MCFGTAAILREDEQPHPRHILPVHGEEHVVEETGDENVLLLESAVDGDENAQRSGGGDIARPGHLCGGAPPTRGTNKRRAAKRLPLRERYRRPPMMRARAKYFAFRVLCGAVWCGEVESTSAAAAAVAFMWSKLTLPS